MEEERQLSPPLLPPSSLAALRQDFVDLTLESEEEGQGSSAKGDPEDNTSSGLALWFIDLTGNAGFHNTNSNPIQEVEHGLLLVKASLTHTNS